jgi:methionine--tRNA ligase beta chain
MSDKTFYVTTPIYYVNARPHIGHAYTTIVADVLARRHRLLGEDTFFLTGTDEHGQKIERSAAAAGIPPQQFADKVSQSFEDLWKRMGILRDTGDPLYQQDYIRTTDPRHIRGVQKLFSELYARGFIYLASYTGAYCVSDEAFVDAPVGTPCPDCGRILEEVTEENFFFKLSEFQRPLIDLIESNALIITPDSSRNEVLSFLRAEPNTANASKFGRQFEPDVQTRLALINTERRKNPEYDSTSPDWHYYGKSAAKTDFIVGGLKDLSISRSSFTWGIPVPDDIQKAAGATQPHVIYVWLDALANYMTALGYGSSDDANWKKFWPADLHLVGKEITRFHCVYWPAFLLAAKLPTPKQVTANGWLLFDNSKMSKSKGNVVRAETILDAFGNIVYASIFPNSTHAEQDLFATDVLRYFLLAEIPFGESGDFAFESLIDRYNAELANGYGNFVSRTTAMIQKYFDGVIPTATKLDSNSWQKSQWLEYAFSVSKQLSDGASGVGSQSITTAVNARLVRAFLNSRNTESTSASYGSAIEAFEEFLDSTGRSKALVAIEDIDVPDFRTYLEKKDFAEQTVSSYLSAVRRLREFSKTFTDSTLVDVVSRAFLCSELSTPRLSRFAFNTFLSEIQLFQATVERYLTERKPWKLGGEANEESNSLLKEVLYTAAESIRIITALLYPILPYATAKVWHQLGLGDIEQAAREGKLTTLEWGGLKPGTKLGPLGPIFPRADKGLANIMTDMENPTPVDATPTDPAAITHTPTTDPAAGPRTSTLPEPTGTLPVGGSTALTAGPADTPSHAQTQASGIFVQQPPAPLTTDNGERTTPQITIDDFAKIELRVAQILVAERIPKADKLLRLEVDLGPDFPRRQILSGIAEWYTPEDLIGRRIVVITNLAPRKMRGLESHGMLLAASHGENGKPVLATFGEDIALGSRLK